MAAGEHVATADQRLVMYNVPWAHYEVQLALRGENLDLALLCSFLDRPSATEAMRAFRDHLRRTTPSAP